MTNLYKTNFLTFKSVKINNNAEWYYVSRNNDTKDNDSAVVITTLVKIDDKYNFLFLKTKRPPINFELKAKYCIESPAGLICDENKNETLIECVKKELLEETGLVADNIFIDVKNSSSSGGLSSETLTFTTAIINEYNVVQKPIDDNGVIADRFFVEVNKIREYFSSLDNSIYSIASPTVAGVYFALEHIK